jgi:uncharacterized membrane protein YbaN (DUF454 family)
MAVPFLVLRAVFSSRASAEHSWRFREKSLNKYLKKLNFKSRKKFQIFLEMQERLFSYFYSLRPLQINGCHSNLAVIKL